MHVRKILPVAGLIAASALFHPLAAGRLPEDIFVEDMLHMNETGLWIEVVRPALMEHEAVYER